MVLQSSWRGPSTVTPLPSSKDKERRDGGRNSGALRKFAALLTTVVLWAGLTVSSLAAPIIFENGSYTTTPDSVLLVGTGSSYNYSVSNNFSVSVAETAGMIAFSSSPAAGRPPIESIQWSISSAVNGGGTVFGAGSAAVTNALTAPYRYFSTFTLPNVDLPVGSYYLTLNGVILEGGSVGSAYLLGGQGGTSTATQIRTPPEMTYTYPGGSYFAIYSAVPELNAAQASLPFLIGAILLVTRRRSRSGAEV